MQGHGWIGVRFQKPDEEPSDFIIHIILNDQDARLQQETVGVIEQIYCTHVFMKMTKRSFKKNLRLIK